MWVLVQELTQHKGHRDELSVVVAVNRELLKKPPLIIFEYKPSEGNKDMDKEISLSNVSDLLLAAAASRSPVTDLLNPSWIFHILKSLSNLGLLLALFSLAGLH